MQSLDLAAAPLMLKHALDQAAAQQVLFAPDLAAAQQMAHATQSPRQHGVHLTDILCVRHKAITILPLIRKMWSSELQKSGSSARAVRSEHGISISVAEAVSPCLGSCEELKLDNDGL